MFSRQLFDIFCFDMFLFDIFCFDYVCDEMFCIYIRTSAPNVTVKCLLIKISTPQH